MGRFEETPEMTDVLGPQVRRSSAVKGRKKCTTCGKLPGDMVSHWKTERDTHGPMSTANPEALRNLPGLDSLSKHVGSIFKDRRL